MVQRQKRRVVFLECRVEAQQFGIESADGDAMRQNVDGVGEHAGRVTLEQLPQLQQIAQAHPGFRFHRADPGAIARAEQGIEPVTQVAGIPFGREQFEADAAPEFGAEGAVGQQTGVGQ